MYLRRLVFLALGGCAAESPVDSASTDEPSVDSGDTAADAGDTAEDTAVESTPCDGLVDLGGITAATAGTVDVMVDARQPKYSFSAGSTAAWSVASPAGGEGEAGEEFTVAFPAERWVLTATADSSSEYLPTLHTGWGAPTADPQVRVFHRADLATRLSAAGWSVDTGKGLVGVYALDPAGAAIQGAIVSLGEATFGHAFIWTAVSVVIDPQTGATVDMHLPEEQTSMATQGGALYVMDVCPGMAEVSVEGPCGACWLAPGDGAGGPSGGVPVAVAADSLSMSWWTCETTCD